MSSFFRTIKMFFCRIGLHWMEGHDENFFDVVAYKPVYDATCACGCIWLVETTFPIVTFKVEKRESPGREDPV